MQDTEPLVRADPAPAPAQPPPRRGRIITAIVAAAVIVFAAVAHVTGPLIPLLVLAGVAALFGLTMLFRLGSRLLPKRRRGRLRLPRVIRTRRVAGGPRTGAGGRGRRLLPQAGRKTGGSRTRPKGLTAPRLGTSGRRGKGRQPGTGLGPSRRVPGRRGETRLRPPGRRSLGQRLRHPFRRAGAPGRFLPGRPGRKRPGTHSGEPTRQRSRWRRIGRGIGTGLLLPFAAPVALRRRLRAWRHSSPGSPATQQPRRSRLRRIGGGIRTTLLAPLLPFVALRRHLRRTRQIRRARRVGGIYALERIALDSARDQPTVMEVLSIFVRESSHWSPFSESDSVSIAEPAIRPDLQAAIAVVGRRDTSRDIRRIDFSGANLTGADLTRANLTGVDLTRADLTRADLTDAVLSGARLQGAHLTRAAGTGANLTDADIADADIAGADLFNANFSDANLSSADLSGASLRYAHFTGADLTEANLSGTVLAFADLTDADLTRANLVGADLTGASWPSHSAVPEGWRREANSARLKRADIASGTVTPT